MLPYHCATAPHPTAEGEEEGDGNSDEDNHDKDVVKKWCIGADGGCVFVHSVSC